MIVVATAERFGLLTPAVLLPDVETLTLPSDTPAGLRPTDAVHPPDAWRSTRIARICSWAALDDNSKQNLKYENLELKVRLSFSNTPN